jgi:hypothetical protein
MRRKLIAIASILVILVLTTTSAFAINPILSANFRYGSMIAEGTVSGIQSTAVTITLVGTGTPVVSCASPSGQLAPGQNPPKVSAQDEDKATPNSKRGHVRFSLEAEVNTSGLSAKQLGCPSNKWTATVLFINWTSATLIVKDTAGNYVLPPQNYACTTTPPSSPTSLPTLSCTPI